MTIDNKQRARELQEEWARDQLFSVNVQRDMIAELLDEAEARGRRAGLQWAAEICLGYEKQQLSERARFPLESPLQDQITGRQVGAYELQITILALLEKTE